MTELKKHEEQSVSLRKRILIYTILLLFGLFCGAMARPTIPTDENADVKVPLAWVCLYLVNPDQTIYDAMSVDDPTQGILDLHQFNSQGEAYAFLKSVFDRSIWYSILGGLIGLIVGYITIRIEASHEEVTK